MSTKKTSQHISSTITRYAAILVVILFVAVAIFLKVAQIKFVEGDEWRKIGERNTYVRKEEIKANRGSIFADDDRLLAISIPKYKVFMDFRADGLIADTLKNYIDPLSTQLARRFPSKTKAEYAKFFQDGLKMARDEKNILARYKRGEKVNPTSKSRRLQLIKEDLDYIQYQDLKSLIFFKKGVNKTGLYHEEKTSRLRPFEQMAVRTVGSLNNDPSLGGNSGIELKYNDILKGTSGLGISYRAGLRKVTNTLVEPIDGLDIKTTINVDYQDIAEQALKARLIETEAESGCAILMEVETGEIKAISNLDRAQNGSYYEGKPNAFSYMSEPGSTFKAVSILVALNDGVVTPETIIDGGDGLMKYNTRIIRDHDAGRKDKSHWTLQEGMNNSSNVIIAKAILKGYEDNPKKFVEGIHKMGLGENLTWDVPLQGREGTISIRYPDDKTRYWSKTTLPWMSFGYETQVPPIYMLMFYNAIANNGKMIKPFITKAFLENGSVVEEFKGEVINKKIASNKALEDMTKMLKDVVDNGTGKPVKSEHVTIAGKTGTAQIAEGGRYERGRNHYVSFVGFFPVEKPRYTCFVGVRRPNNSSSARVAGAVFKDIAESVYVQEMVKSPIAAPVDTLHSHLPDVKVGLFNNASIVLEELDLDYKSSNVKSDWVTTKTEESKILFSDLEHIGERIVPNVKGMGLRDAIFLLENLGLKVNVEGAGRIYFQSLLPGVRVDKRQEITIKLK